MRYRYMYSSMVPQAVRLYVLTTRRAKFSQFAAFAYCLPILRAGGGVALCQPLDISSGRSQKAKLASEHIEFHPIRRNNFLHLPRHHRCPRSLRSPHYSHRKNADLSFVAPPSKFPEHQVFACTWGHTPCDIQIFPYTLQTATTRHV